MNQAIGYIGTDAADIVIYTARILHNFKFRVCIYDYSGGQELSCCIPACSKESDGLLAKIDFQGVDYTKQELEEDYEEKYKVVLLFFGMNHGHAQTRRCEHMVYVSDSNRHNLEALRAIPALKSKAIQGRQLVVRDVAGSFGLDVCLKEIAKALEVKKKDITVVKYSLDDIKAKANAQWNDKKAFKGISGGLYDFLVDCIEENIIGQIDWKKSKVFKASIDAAMAGK